MITIYRITVITTLSFCHFTLAQWTDALPAVACEMFIISISQLPAHIQRLEPAVGAACCDWSARPGCPSRWCSGGLGSTAEGSPRCTHRQTGSLQGRQNMRELLLLFLFLFLTLQIFQFTVCLLFNFPEMFWTWIYAENTNIHRVPVHSGLTVFSTLSSTVLLSDLWGYEAAGSGAPVRSECYPARPRCSWSCTSGCLGWSAGCPEEPDPPTRGLRVHNPAPPRSPEEERRGDQEGQVM